MALRVVPLAAALALTAPRAGADDRPIRPTTPMEEHAEVVRGMRVVRIDPKRGAPPGECDTLRPTDLAVAVAGRPGKVISVERLPRPERHWLLMDISESAEERRNEAKRSARQYVREVMTPGKDVAALVTIDEDALLVAGPTSDAKFLDAQIARVPPGGTSALRDGLSDVLRQIQGDRHEHLILYWTDGFDIGSLTTVPELLALLDRVPNATVFPIALLPASKDLLVQSPVGPFLFDVAQRSGGEVLASSDARWIERVRGWIARRFTVEYALGASPSNAEPAFSIAGRRCQVTVLPDPFARPDAVAGTAPAVPEAWVRLHAEQGRKTDDPACATTGEAPWTWPLRAGAGGLEGCVLDVVEAPGPLITHADPRRALDVVPARMAARQVTVRTPPLAELPDSLADALDALVPPDDAAARSPNGMIEGAAFLSERARIAASLFASSREYHDFALARLRALADRELRDLEADLSGAFPSLPPSQVAEAARASRAGRRALLAADHPSDVDLARVLAAWIRDVPARDAVLDWERLFIDRRLAGRAGPDDAARWQRLRDRLAVPSRVRVVVPLAAVRDREHDVVGFERVVLPRPEGFNERLTASRHATERGDDRLPDRPFGLALVDALCARPEIARRLAERGYRAEALDVAPVGPPWKAMTADAYRHATVTLTLAAADGTSRAVVQARAEAVPGRPTEVGPVEGRVTGDAALEVALAAGRAVPAAIPATPPRSSLPR